MVASEHGPSGIESLFFWKHKAFTNGIKSALKFVGIGAAAMVIAPPILCCAGVGSVPGYIVAGSIGTAKGIEFAENLKKSRKGGGHDAGHH